MEIKKVYILICTWKWSDSEPITEIINVYNKKSKAINDLHIQVQKDLITPGTLINKYINNDMTLKEDVYIYTYCEDSFNLTSNYEEYIELGIKEYNVT